jgi:hypothetical protein
MNYLTIGAVLLLFISCGKNNNGESTLRSASGEGDEIIVVVDSVLWEGPVGREIRKIYMQPMKGMPQDEALFDLHKVNPMKLNSVLKSMHNMIFVMTLDRKSPESERIKGMFTNESLKRVQKEPDFFQATESNKFARDQKIMYLFGQDEETLASNISENRDVLLRYFMDQTERLTRRRLFKSRERDIENVLTKHHGYSLKVPYGYELAKDLKDFVWLRELDGRNDREKNIFIYEQPYGGPEDFANIAALRDKITELYLRDSQNPELYILRQEGTGDVPFSVLTERVTFNGKYAIKARGLWAVSDLTRGGPFMSYTMVDEQKQMLYYIEGFVYHAAGKKKRLMQEMQAILSTFKTPSEISS